MASKIEEVLYGELASHVNADGDVGNHCLQEFSIFRDQLGKTDIIRIAVTPNSREYAGRTVAIFNDAILVSFTFSPQDPEWSDLPWLIHAFHSNSEDGKRWSFTLQHFDGRIHWISDWPEVTIPG